MCFTANTPQSPPSVHNVQCFGALPARVVQTNLHASLPLWRSCTAVFVCMAVVPCSPTTADVDRSATKRRQVKQCCAVLTVVLLRTLHVLQVLTNALYFKGIWEYPFEKRRTRAQAFAAVTKDSTAKVGGWCSRQARLVLPQNQGRYSNSSRRLRVQDGWAGGGYR